MRPSIDEVQLALVQAGKVIMSVSKGVATWRKSSSRKKLGNGSKTPKNGLDSWVPNSESNKELKLYSARKEEKPVITEKPSNFFKTVSESKEVSKMNSMLSGCMQVTVLKLFVMNLNHSILSVENTYITNVTAHLYLISSTTCIFLTIAENLDFKH